MLNFRKLKKDYSTVILKEGRDLYENGSVVSTRIVQLTPQSIRLNCRVLGNFNNSYECELEIDRTESSTVDSNCDCSYKYDCQHIAAVVFSLEEMLDNLLMDFSKGDNFSKTSKLSDQEAIRKSLEEVESKEIARIGKKLQKELMQEYVGAAQMLGKSPFFLKEEQLSVDQAELAVVFNKLSPQNPDYQKYVEIQLALRLPFRSKPLNIFNIREFLESVRYQEPFYINSKRYFLTEKSFDEHSASILRYILDFARFPEPKADKNLRSAYLDFETWGMALSHAYEYCITNVRVNRSNDEEEHHPFQGLYFGSLEEPLRYSTMPARLRVGLEYLEVPAPKILLNPMVVLDQDKKARLEEVHLFDCTRPGMISQNTYFSFSPLIKRKHLKNLASMREVTIPEPLFGTFVENSLPEMMRYAELENQEIIDRFVTLPFAGKLSAECDIHYLNGELEATLYFLYDGIKIPASTSQLSPEHVVSFVTNQGILARNLAEEQEIINDLFQDFIYDSAQGVYQAKTDKKIVEFMTDVIPRNQQRVKFNCPENLLGQFIYDDTKFKLKLKESSRVDVYEVDLEVNGHLCGLTLDLLWECISSRRNFVELNRKPASTGKKGQDSTTNRLNKILVLDLERINPVVRILDEIGIKKLENHKDLRPLWSLVSIEDADFKNLPIEFSMSSKLKQIQKQMLGHEPLPASKIPSIIKATLRKYQEEGVHWLERLRNMHLSGILADDMGLGKTLQAIISITQDKINNPKAISIVVCPTSLIYNWKEEFTKFNAKLKVLPIDGIPAQRAKLLKEIKKQDVIITSYSLLQKDIDHYKEIPFSYAILDEAQHIKNRGTRNAQSVKCLQAAHRLILTGTPIENSLEELWSLFDFLMPGLLSSYDRFIEKYLRLSTKDGEGKKLDGLRRKLSPFIMRRMKKDVLSELPPVSEIPYHCSLSDTQRELYRSYAASAREELTRLVKEEGFDKVQIHVLATLTRLKQICCHPAIFAKEKAEKGDSAKYDMLMELLQTLIEGNHKTVIFSQYTKMLQIMRNDLQQAGIKFEYLDGSSKNRLSIVKKFNEDQNIPIFLVSLKAGGSGLNLVGADTVVHYDMWWNPAVEAQATDRVHRIGQKSAVSAYKLITMGTIEEKIVEMQNRKKELVQQVINTDEEAISKLTWEEVLELLQT